VAKEDFRRCGGSSGNPGWPPTAPLIPGEDLRTYFARPTGIDSLERLYASPHIDGFIGEADGEAAGWARTQFPQNKNRLYPRLSLPSARLSGKGIGGGCSGRPRRRPCLWPPGDLVGVMVQNEAARGFYERRGSASSGRAVSDGANDRSSSDRVKAIAEPRRGQGFAGENSRRLSGRRRSASARRDDGRAPREAEGNMAALAEGYASLEAAGCGRSAAGAGR